MLDQNTVHPRPIVPPLARLLPGIGLCILVTAIAYLLQAIEIDRVGRPWLEALVFAILLGVAIRSLWTPASRWRAGIEFSAKTLLEIAVVLLGASVSVRAVLAIGPALIGGIAIVVVVAIATSEAVRMPMPCMAKTEPTKAPRLRAVENSAAMVAESFVEFSSLFCCFL